MAFRSALVLTCLVLAAGRRHAETPSLLSPEIDLGQVEAEAAAMLENITPQGSDDGPLIPLEASFQVGPSMADIQSKTKLTLHLAHVPMAPAEPLSVVVTLTAKDEDSATSFADSLRDYWTYGSSQSSHGPPVTVNVTAPGRQVTVRIAPINSPEQEKDLIHAAEGFALVFGEANMSVAFDYDMLEFLAHLTNETVLYAELYKGIRYSINATLKQSFEKLLAEMVHPTPTFAPGQMWHPELGFRPGFGPGRYLGRPDNSYKEMMDKLFNLFTGASASFKVVFDDSVREEILRSLPGVNMTYGTMVGIYRELVRLYDPQLRGGPEAMKILKFLHNMENMETLDTVELTGVPGLRAMVVDNTTHGLFQFFGKFTKDIGLIDVLKNTSTMFPRAFNVTEYMKTLYGKDALH